MRITFNIKSVQDVESAYTALTHFIKQKKPNDGTSNVWGIGITGGNYFAVEAKPNGNFSVKQQ